MKNKKRNTIIWILTWAVLFLVVAYSPIGRPDLYVGNSYYTVHHGVNFKGGIANAPKGATFATEEEDSEIEDYTPAADYIADYAGNASEYSPQNTNSGDANYSSASGSNKSSGQSGFMVLSGSASKGSAQGTATAQSNDVSSLSSDLTLTSSASTDRQAAGGAKGGRDPGGKKPKNPIPVGDGMWFLIIMAGVYVFWRKHQTAKATT
ncbi:MAG: hypothetical protein JZU53_09650 [Paludibacter sp.]|nr:hypothetical protein [Paludibacter sp.]